MVKQWEGAVYTLKMESLPPTGGGRTHFGKTNQGVYYITKAATVRREYRKTKRGGRASLKNLRKSI
jgi:hypothetical protein